MNILTSCVKNELKVKNSRFIAELLPCSNQPEARNKIKEQKERYKDARHVVHAFIVGPHAEISGMSDDGEPSGTAGRPVLDVLKGRDVTNILLTVTRYFGGTLLGTGGLVKAYGDSAKFVLDKAVEENVFILLADRSKFSFEVSYTLYNNVKWLLGNFDVSGLKEQFGEEVNISGKIEKSQVPVLIQQIRDITSGSSTVRIDTSQS